MTQVEETHAEHGATFESVAGRRRVAHYGRPDTAVGAVRNGVGVIETDYGVVVVEGSDRHEFVDDAVSNHVPAEDGRGTYALLLDPQGRVRTDVYVYHADERLLLFVPPGEAAPLADDWAGKVFIQDVTVREATDEFAVFGVHGPRATEKVASVLNGAGAPAESLSFVRGSMADAGVTVIATDAQTGEEGYEVVCAASEASEVIETLLTRGVNAAPFGHETWNTLTVEAGTPQFGPELDGRIPNVAGVRNALDFEKGCYVGQEVVSKVANRGRPSRQLVGLRPEAVPDAEAAVFDGDSAVGEVTRAVHSPTLDAPVALAYVSFDTDADAFTVRVDSAEVAAERVSLPFVDGSARSGRLPTYD